MKGTAFKGRVTIKIDPDNRKYRMRTRVALRGGIQYESCKDIHDMSRVKVRNASRS